MKKTLKINQNNDTGVKTDKTNNKQVKTQKKQLKQYWQEQLKTCNQLQQLSNKQLKNN